MQIDRSSQSLLDKNRQNQNSNLTFCAPLFQYCCMCKTGYRMVTQKRNVPNANLNTLLQKDLENCSLGIYIDNVAMLGSEVLNFIRPTIIVRIVDIETGYYKKCNSGGAAIRHTHSCKLNTTNSTPSFHQDLLFDVELRDAIEPNSLVLFEIVDLSLEHSKLDSSSLLRIAWGFLLPISSIGKSNISNETCRIGPGQYDMKHRIQLYKCHGSGFILDKIQASSMGLDHVDFTPRIDSNMFNDWSIPAVYLEWRRQNVKPILGLALCISLGLRQAKKNKALDESQDRHSLTGSNKSIDNNLKKYEVDENERKVRLAVLTRSRNKDESCVIPNKLLQRYSLNGYGALMVSYSHSGHLLAIASLVSNDNSQNIDKSAVPSKNIYALHLIDTDYGQIIWTETVAHLGPVYTLEWSDDDTTLISCSSDGTIKIWNVISLHPLLKKYIILLNLADRDTKNLDNIMWQPHLLQTLVSPSPSMYVYCAVFSEMKSLTYSTQKELDTKNIIIESNLYNDFKNCAFALTTEDLIPQYFDILKQLDRCWTQNLEVYEVFNTEYQLKSIPEFYTGSSTGHICVWNGFKYLGDVYIRDENGNKYSAHDARINTITIDNRSKYLISADSEGDINMWRKDNNDWFQFLRKIKNDVNVNNTTIIYHPLHTGVLSLIMHPNKNTPHMLCMSQNPPSLRVINMATLRIHTTCVGFTSSHTISPSYNASSNQTVYGDYCFCRAQYSASGEFIIVGVGVTIQDDRKSSRMIHKLLIWDAQSGQQVGKCILSGMYMYLLVVV